MVGPRYFLFGLIKKFFPQNGEKNVMRNWISFLDDKNAHVQLHMSFIHVTFLHTFFFNIFFPLLAFFFFPDVACLFFFFLFSLDLPGKLVQYFFFFCFLLCVCVCVCFFFPWFRSDFFFIEMIFIFLINLDYWFFFWGCVSLFWF